jgi:hypothetical protein
MYLDAYFMSNDVSYNYGAKFALIVVLESINFISRRESSTPLDRLLLMKVEV